MNEIIPIVSQEALIERKLTFRNSTFCALKEYMQEHQARTGQALTNAAAVDRLIRAQLSLDSTKGAA